MTELLEELKVFFRAFNYDAAYFFLTTTTACTFQDLVPEKQPRPFLYFVAYVFWNYYYYLILVLDY